MGTENKTLLLLSSSTFVGYGLDMVFMLAKELNYDGLELALWNNFDAWNIDYIQRLIKTYDLPVYSIQTSNKVNKKELSYAVELALEVGAKNINVNAPKSYNRKSLKFMQENLPAYQKTHSTLKFSIVNPPTNYYLNVLPEYSFINMAEILSNLKLNIALDISNIDEEKFDINLLRKLQSFVPRMPNIYLSDKDKKGKSHLPLGEGNLKIPSFLKKLKQLEYDGQFVIKLDIEKNNLADIEKIKIMLKKCKVYYLENYINLKL